MVRNYKYGNLAIFRIFCALSICKINGDAKGISVGG